jgi:hypothetical protein
MDELYRAAQAAANQKFEAAVAPAKAAFEAAVGPARKAYEKAAVIAEVVRFTDLAIAVQAYAERLSKE